MARSLVLDRETDPRFSQPIRQIMAMVLVLLAVGGGVAAIYVPVRTVFEANLALTAFIASVFVIGVLATFWQVFQLSSAVSWIEGFALDRPGHEFTRAPRLLASLSALLRGKDARKLLNPTSTRSILDSVATRLDEARDINRYIINVLIFLGLLGTFWGLARTVPGVVAMIQSLEPGEGESAVEMFGRLMNGLEDQLEGIGTAFSSSLVGLAGSLVIGLLDLFTGHGQNRFFRELEEWLSSITRIGAPLGDGDSPGSDSAALMIMEQNARQLENLQEMFVRIEEKRSDSDDRLAALAESISTMTERMGRPRAGGPGSELALPVLERIAASQEDLAKKLSTPAGEEFSGLDSETRMRLRNIDVQLLRLLEEMSAGRQESVSELRTELNTLTRTIAEALNSQARR
ncbi:MAG: biopolymer transporter ExbB [Pseudomonadota bacterium]